MVLDEHGGLFTFGSGAGGALGHGDTLGQEFPVKIIEFGKQSIQKVILYRIHRNVLLDCSQVPNSQLFQ